MKDNPKKESEYNPKNSNGKKKDVVLEQARKVLSPEYFNEEYEKITQKFSLIKENAQKSYKQKLEIQKEIKSSLSVNQLLISKTKDKKILKNLQKKKTQLEQYRRGLLNSGSWLMRLFFGSVNDINLEGGKEQRLAFKQEYENLKLNFTIFNIILTFIVYYVPFMNNFLDTIFRLYFFYYYVTVSLREDILRANGSTIDGWWRLHHFWSIVISIVSLSWSPTEIFFSFRANFFYLNLVNCTLQICQYYYQTKRLYVLKSMGKAKDLDVIGENIQTTQHVYLAIIIPFILVDNFLIGFFAFSLLYDCYQVGFGNTEWQAICVGGIFSFLCCGNLVSLFSVISKKLKFKKKFGFGTKKKKK